MAACSFAMRIIWDFKMLTMRMYLNGKDWMSQENGAILFVVIRWSNTKNSAWEPGKSDPAYPNYVIKSDTNFFPINALRIHISQISV